MQTETGPTRLKNPPILQALVEFGLESPLGSIKPLDSLRTKGFPEYEVAPRNSVPDDATSDEQSQIGFEFTDPQTKNVVIATQDGLTYVQRGAYQTWEEFVSQAREAWKIFRDLVQLSGKVTLAVRFSNQFEIELRGKALSHFLTFAPHSSLGRIKDLFSMTRFDEPNDLVEGTVVTTIDCETSPRKVSVTLDITAKSQDSFAMNEDFLEILDDLRKFKNKVFFTSLTESALALFNS